MATLLHAAGQEHERGIGDAHQDPLGRATCRGRDETDQPANEQRYRHGKDADGQGDPGAVNHAGQQIAAELIGPQPVGQGTRRDSLAPHPTTIKNSARVPSLRDGIAYQTG